MRVGVIRGDLPGPVFLSAMESVSQYNPSTEPRGQEVYVSRPTTAEVEGVLANATTGAGAIIQGSDIAGSFPLTLSGANNVLRVRTSATASFTVCTIATGVYSTFAALLVAVNNALQGTGIVAIQGGGSGSRVGLEGAHGVNSYVEVDTTGNGSTADTPLGLTAGARTMPSAATFITATLPVGGPLNVSTATINAVGASTNSNALALVPAARGTQTALANAIAPQFTETDVAIDSFLVGQIAELLNANFNPDSRRQPALTPGAAITVVQDDGVSLFSAVTTLPVVSSATLNSPSSGDITIAGTGLGSSERLETVVKVSGVVNKVLQEKIIAVNGGSVSATSIVLKAVLIPGATTVTTSVRVKVRQQVSASVAVS